MRTLSVYREFGVADIVRTLRTLSMAGGIVRNVRTKVCTAKTPPLLIVRKVSIVRGRQCIDHSLAPAGLWFLFTAADSTNRG
jgi:hypothetical protein